MLRASISMGGDWARRSARVQVSASRAQRLARKTLSLLLDFDDFPAGIVPAIWADPVRQVLLTAVGTSDQRAWPNGVVSPSTVPTPLGMFPLRKRWHAVLLVRFTIAPAAWAGGMIITGGLGESRQADLPGAFHLRGQPPGSPNPPRLSSYGANPDKQIGAGGPPSPSTKRTCPPRIEFTPFFPGIVWRTPAKPTPAADGWAHLRRRPTSSRGAGNARPCSTQGGRSRLSPMRHNHGRGVRAFRLAWRAKRPV